VLTDGAAVDLVDGFEAVDVPPAPVVLPPPVVPPQPVVPPPATTPPPATLQPPAVVPPAATPPGPVLLATVLKINDKVVNVRGDRVSLRVSCPATSTSHCSGLLTLRAGGRALGRAHFDVAPGRTSILRVKLAKTSRRLAQRSRRVKVVAVATTGSAGRVRGTSHQLTLAFRGR
jgi:hypothetical protein